MKTTLLVFLAFLSVWAFGQDEQLRTDWANLEKYAADNKTLGDPLPGEQRVVFMGNSITESWKTIDGSFFGNKSYVCRGISGQTSPQMLVRFRQDVIALKPSVVVILSGINDIAENTGPITLDKVVGNIISMAELARANGIRVVLSSVLPAYDFPWHSGLQPAGKIVALNAMIKSYCTNSNTVYVDYYSTMVDERMGLDKKYTDDGVHPTMAGYRIMEPLIEEAIAKALSQ
jgi:lysophospholipase L1-like esterase